jgi:hypothetical protein
MKNLSFLCLLIGSLSVQVYAEQLAPVENTVIALNSTKAKTEANAQSILQDSISHFVHNYTQTLTQTDVKALMKYYDSNVHYYSWGMVEKSIIAEEKRDYFERWPIVKQKILGQVSIMDTEEPTEKLVSYLLAFSVENPTAINKSKQIKGEARHILRLKQSEQSFKIIAEQQTVLSRETLND